MNVFTYYDPSVASSLNTNGDDELIELWRNSWKSCHWNPVILGPADVPEWAGPVLDRTDRFPAVNPKGYERACFARWAAVSAFIEPGPGWMVDYDVLNLSFLPHLPDDRLMIYQDYNPALVSGSAEEFARIFRFFGSVDPDIHVTDPRYRIEDRPHVSEQYILLNNRFLYDSCRTLLWSNIDADWKTAAVVHFAAGAVPGGRENRVQFIRDFLRERSAA